MFRTGYKVRGTKFVLVFSRALIEMLLKIRPTIEMSSEVVNLKFRIDCLEVIFI